MYNIAVQEVVVRRMRQIDHTIGTEKLKTVQGLGQRTENEIENGHIAEKDVSVYIRFVFKCFVLYTIYV